MVPAAALLIVVLGSATLFVVNARRSRFERSAAAAGGLGFPDRSVAVHRIEPPERLFLFGQLSQDGRYIPYSEFDDGGLMALDVTTGTTRRITDNDAGASASVEHAAMSADGTRVAYSWESSECGCIELRVADVSNQRDRPRVLLHEQSLMVVNPVDWTPDGTGILTLLWKKDGTRTIAQVSTVDGSRRVLKDGLEYGLSMHLSPDGRFVAYDYPVRANEDARNIFVLPVEGGRAETVVDSPAQDAYPSWTPDGRGIVFVSDRSGALGLWIVPVGDGHALESPQLVMKDMGRVVPASLSRTGRLFYQLQSHPVDAYVARFDASGVVGANTVSQAAATFLGSNLDPAWSPDGSAIAFVSRRRTIGPRAQALVIRRLSGGRDRELWPPLENFTQPRWSPDGRSILVRGTDRVGAQHLLQLDAQSGAIMATFPPSLSNEWASDGRTFYSVANRRVWTTDVSSGTRREVYRDPGGAGIVGLAVSPADGSLAIGLNTENGRKIQVISTELGQARDVWHEQLRGRRRPKRPRRHADDGVLQLVDRDLAANHVRRKAEIPFPESVRNDDDPIAPRLAVGEVAAKPRMHAEDAEVVRGDAQRGHLLRFAESGDRARAGLDGRHVFERAALLLVIEIVGSGRSDPCRAAGTHLPDEREPVRFGKWQRPNEKGVDDAEHRRVRPDADCEHADDDCREQRITGDRSQRIADVGGHRSDANRESCRQQPCRFWPAIGVANEQLSQRLFDSERDCLAIGRLQAGHVYWFAGSCCRPMALARGTRLGPYEILSSLGAGGMDEVYRARDAELGRDVAIKVLPPAVAQDAERLIRFRREAQLLAALNHPNIGMPLGKEQTLAADEVYALTAFLLFKNSIITEDDVMDAQSLPKVVMPNRDGAALPPEPRQHGVPRLKNYPR